MSVLVPSVENLSVGAGAPPGRRECRLPNANANGGRPSVIRERRSSTATVFGAAQGD